MVSNDVEAKLSFLLSGTYDVVPSSCFKLRSYLNIYLSNLAHQQNYNLPKSFRNRNKTCPYCYTPWNCDTTSFKLLPSKKCKFRKAQNEEDTGVKKELRNTLVLKCKVCTNKSCFSLIKKEHKKEVVKEVVTEETMKLSKKRKKKKKKDKSCGLIVNLKKIQNSVPQVSKKEKRLEIMKKVKKSDTVFKHPEGKISDLKKNMSTSKEKSGSVFVKSKKVVRNPFAAQSQSASCRKKDKNLQSLKNAIKGARGLNTTKKTLQDFLRVI